jgi:hypothetical protein
MGLSRKISTIYIRQEGYTTSDWKYHFKASNSDIAIGQVNYGSSYDEAIDASLRSNIRGLRLNVSLSWDKLTSATVDKEINGGSTTDSDLASFLGDMVSRFIVGDSYVEISFDNTNWDKVIPDDSALRTIYTSQIGRGSGSLNLIGQEMVTSINAHLKAPEI